MTRITTRELGAKRRGTLVLRIYLAGNAPNSAAALANLRAVLAAHAERPAEIEVIDVLEDPDRGVRDGVVVTPLLVKAVPAPERRIIGSLSDRQALLSALGLEGT